MAEKAIVVGQRAVETVVDFTVHTMEASSKALTRVSRSITGSRTDLPEAARRTKLSLPKSTAILLVRSVTVWMRSLDTKIFGHCVLIAGTIVVGIMQGSEKVSTKGVPTLPNFATDMLLPIVVLGLLSTVFALNTFVPERLTYWRESSCGVSLTAYFLSKNVIDLVDVFLMSLSFAIPYKSLVDPRMSFNSLYWPCFGVTWTTMGMGYAVGMTVSSGKVTMAAVVIALVLGIFFGGVQPAMVDFSGAQVAVSAVTFSRWASDALAIEEARAWPDAYFAAKSFMLSSYGYCNYDTVKYVPSRADSGSPALDIATVDGLRSDFLDECDVGLLFTAQMLLGLAFRALALILIHVCYRNKQV